jgi:hypothetical protein
MRIRHAFRIINWSAAAIAVAVLVIGKDKDYPWIAVAILAAVSLHFLIETGALFRRLRFRRRFSDTREFREHRPFAAKDLEETLSSDSTVAGVTLPVVLNGTIGSTAEKKAPLSGRKAVAWRLVAEPMEGIGRVGGQVLVVDSWWPDLTVRDETGSIPIRGPGVLDGSSLVERICSVGSLHSELPDLAARVKDGLGIKEASKEEKSLRVALREIALLPKDKVVVYGNAQRTADGLSVFGSDTLDDPGSLMVRAASRPASSRIPRRLAATGVFTLLSIALLGGTIALASSTAASSLFAPGGIFDASRTAKVSLDLDGRPLRVSIGDSHWDIDPGTATKGYALSADSKDFTAGRASTLRIQAVHPLIVTIHNGDDGYPRWDGAAWQLETGGLGSAAAASVAPAASTAPAPAVPAAADAARSGPLYVRNLTGTAVTVRVLGPDNTPMSDTSWTFNSYEAADDPRGLYLEAAGKPLKVPAAARLEITTKKGYLRILPVSAVGKWGTSASWRFEIVPEYIAGAGNLWVKNSGDLPIRIWILGADGKPLFGDNPWSFEPKEGVSENRGLRLQYNDKNIVITGREAIKVETRELSTLYEGPLERLASWKAGAWTVDVSRAVPKD